MDLKKAGSEGVNCIHLVYNGVQLWALVSAMLNPQVP